MLRHVYLHGPTQFSIYTCIIRILYNFGYQKYNFCFGNTGSLLFKSCSILTQFLGAFTKLRKAINSFVVSIRLSVWNNSVPTGRIFVKFGIREIFENLSRKFKFH